MYSTRWMNKNFIQLRCRTVSTTIISLKESFVKITQIYKMCTLNIVLKV
jgi:hypothetical protein